MVQNLYVEKYYSGLFKVHLPPHSRTDSVKRFLTHTPSLSDWCAGSKLATNIVKVSLREGWPQWKVQVDRCVSTFIMITLNHHLLLHLMFSFSWKGKGWNRSGDGTRLSAYLRWFRNFSAEKTKILEVVFTQTALRDLQGIHGCVGIYRVFFFHWYPP